MIAGVTVVVPSSGDTGGSSRLFEGSDGGEYESSLTSPGIEEAQVWIDRVTGGAGVVDAEQYKEGRALNLEDALRFAPGVFAKSRFGAEETRLSIRGSGIQRSFHLRGIKLLQDGIPINTADGSADFGSIDPLAYRYIQVWRGANALQYGATTLGGAINFVMPTGYDASLIQARAEAGSFGYVRGQISSGEVIGTTDYFTSLTHHSQDGFRQHSEQDNQRFLGNVGLRLSDVVETRFYVNFARSDSELPGAITKAQLDKNPEKANPANMQGAGDYQRDVEYARLGNKTIIACEQQQLTIDTYYAFQRLDHPVFDVIVQRSHDVGLGLRFDSKADQFENKNFFTLGANLGAGRTDARQYVNTGGSRGAETANGWQTAHTAELYLENQHYPWEAFALIFGGQLVWSGRHYDDDFTAANGDQSSYQDYFGYSPKVGGRYEFGDESAARTWRGQVFANFSRSFEPPTFAELVNLGGDGLLNLDAQTAWTVEVGTRGESARIAWEFVYYYAWVKDELLGYDVAGVPRTTNADDTVHEGIEAALDVAVIEGLLAEKEDGKRPDRILLRQVYLWNNFQFDDDGSWGDNELPGIPEHFYRAELMYEHPCGFYIGPNMEWSPWSYPVDMESNLTADDHVIMGARAGYQHPIGLRVYVEGRNLLNEEYAATTGVITSLATAGVSPAQFFPGDGRSFYAGVEWRW